MDYRELFREENEDIRERYDLAMERIGEIAVEQTVSAPYRAYFSETAGFIGMIRDLCGQMEAGTYRKQTLAELQSWNQRLYEDILPEAYQTSYANPAYAVSALGEEHGRVLSFLYTEIRGMIAYAFEARYFDITICSELFIQIYNLFEEEVPSYRELKKIIYWFVSDYSEITVTFRIRELLDPQLSLAADIIQQEDLNDLRYLYFFGEFISDNELKMAAHLNAMTQEQIDRIASVYTEGYRIGFETTGKDLSKKRVVNIRYNLGFERVVRAALGNFDEIGLRPTIYRAAVNSINKRQQHKIGYFGAIANKQYEYDHKDDNALYLDNAFKKRKLGVLTQAYETYKELAAVHAGPAVIETFGEVPFELHATKEAFRLSARQQKLSVEYDNEAGQIVNRYIPGDERSFTIIAFPVPEIGPEFSAIFDEIVRVNTLDYSLYQGIQQEIIDVLDQGEYVEIKGTNGNRTDLRICLYPLEDPQKQTKFENCVADVNIPVGEVFTSPVLKGTCGKLHVSEVYLNELKYVDLEIDLTDGMVSGYSCANFDQGEENRRFIRENILFHHDTLPIGEFAIGTNTTAYVVTKRFGIADKMPILIAEKMGPHFAMGDTCYSWSEDNRVYNADGKEIVAKDNEVSILRKEDISKAYFGCHTDITIPYEELGVLQVVRNDGSKIPVILDGRFVLPGTEELNKPFAEGSV